ncbi:MAG: hypothetical protein JSS11_12270 [Verrucomicrobia bacterium]|nr:hypothetical protein [Verrucomicrobiota bacterium]
METMAAYENTKANLALVALVCAIFAAILTPAIFTDSAWRWYVCGGLCVIAYLCIAAHRKAIKAEHSLSTQQGNSRKTTLRRRLISGLGLIVIGPICVLLLREPRVDQRMLLILIGFFALCAALFASSFHATNTPRAKDQP